MQTKTRSPQGLVFHCILNPFQPPEPQHAENRKRITKELRQEIVSYLLPFPSISSDLSFRLAVLIFTKNRCRSHINFIGRCLKSNVIPKGFRASFNPSQFCSSCDRYLAEVKQACVSFSRNVMRSTIRAMSSKRNELDRVIRNCRSELERNCPAVLSKIQELNSKLFHCSTET